MKLNNNCFKCVFSKVLIILGTYQYDHKRTDFCPKNLIADLGFPGLEDFACLAKFKL